MLVGIGNECRRHPNSQKPGARTLCPFWSSSRASSLSWPPITCRRLEWSAAERLICPFACRPEEKSSAELPRQSPGRSRGSQHLEKVREALVHHASDVRFNPYRSVTLNAAEMRAEGPCSGTADSVHSDSAQRAFKRLRLSLARNGGKVHGQLDLISESGGFR